MFDHSTQVYIAGFATANYDSQQEPDLPDACRRFSASEKALVQATEKLSQNAATLWQPFRQDKNAFVAHASLYGEVMSIADVGQRVVDQDYLVSPISFQNSVANAAPAGLCRVQEMALPYSTNVGDWFALEELLHSWWYRLASGLANVVLIVHCEEAMAKVEGRADVFLLANQMWFKQNNISDHERVCYYPEGNFNPESEIAERHHLLEGEQMVPWLQLPKSGQIVERSVENKQGRALKTYLLGSGVGS